MVLFRKRGLKPYKRRFRTLEEAEADRDTYNDKLLAEGAGGVHIGAKERREIETALLLLEESGLSIVQAAQMAADNYRQNKGGKVLAGLVVDFLGEKETRAGDRQQRNLKSMLKLMLKHTKAQKVRDLTREKIESWVYSYSNGTSARNSLAAANNFCGWMVRKGIIEINPCIRIQRPRLEVKEEKLIFQPIEAWRFLRRLERAYPEYVAFYAVLLFGMLRPSEAEGLKKEDLRTKTIRVTRGKMRGRSRRAAPIRPILRKWLDAYEWKVPSQAWQKKCRVYSPIGWEVDICRHTGITYRLAETDDEKKTAREAGNSPDVIYANYYELIDAAAVPFFFAIGPDTKKPR